MNEEGLEYRKALGRVLRAHREQAGLKTSDVASAWGCDRSNVSHAEAGRMNVSMEQIRRHAQLTGRQPAEVIAAVESELEVKESPAGGQAA